jgi:Haem-binding domain
MMVKPRGQTVVLVALGAALASQVVTISHDNPPVTSAVTAPPAVVSILKRSCYDCHSHETIWRWYTYVAPVSWLAGHDVHDGRRHLNFSAWAGDPPNIRQKQMREFVETIQEGEMPPWYYTPVHPAARLSPQDANVLIEWARSQQPDEPR